MKIKFNSYRPWKLFFSVLLCFLPIIAYSQVTGSCAEKLKTAQSLFVKGQVEQVPSILGECMKSGFTREESLSAYKLLIQSYIFEEKQDLADSTMLAFLKINPEYQISPTDHSSFVHLFNNYNVKPVVQIALHFGTNVPFVTFVNPISLSGLPEKSKYSSKALNLFASVEAKFELTKQIELNFEAGYSQLAFTNTESFLGIYKINYTETQNRIELPLSGTYNFKSFGKFTPFGRFGFGPAITISSSAKTNVTGSDINNLIVPPGPDLDIKSSGISLDLFTQLGGGIKYKTRGGYITAEFRSNLGFFNQTTGGGVSTEELRWLYKYAADDFHLNAINFSIGYTQIFYKPSKRKE